MPWFSRGSKADVPTPPPEPPPSAAARKAKEQGWFESIRSKGKGLASPPSAPHGSGGGGSAAAAGEASGTVTKKKSVLGFNGGGEGSRTVSRKFSKRKLQHDDFGAASAKPRAGEPDEAEQLAVATKSLAQRLQELATANEDGLLDDEEYRVLRQGVFEKIAASTAGQDPAVGSQSSGRFPGQPKARPKSYTTPLAPQTKHLAPPSAHGSPSVRRSLRSTRSTASFFSTIFRRGSRAPSVAEDWSAADDSDAASVRHPDAASVQGTQAASIRSGRTANSSHSRFSTIRSPKHRSRKLHGTAASEAGDAADFAALSPGDSPPRSRSIRVRPELHQTLTASANPSIRSGKSSAGPPLSSSSASVLSGVSSTADSHSMSNHSYTKTPTSAARTHSRPSRLVGPSDHSWDPHGDGPVSGREEATAAELRREISDLEYECARLVDTFGEMEKTVIAKYRAPPASGPGAAAGAGLASASVQGEAAAADGSGNEGGDDDAAGEARGRRSRPVSFLAPLPSAATLRARPSMLNAPPAGRRRKPTPAPPAEQDRDDEGFVLPAGPTPLEARSPSPGVAAAAGLAGNPSDEAKLAKEVEGIRAKRKAVEEKYDQRLEYLKAKLKGAMIRERLPK